MPHTTDEHYRLAYDELRGLARHYLQGDGAAGSIRPTELVHEAVGRLHGKVKFEDRKHLIATVARAMRRVLVDAARGRARRRHGANAVQVTLREDAGITNDRTVDILEIDFAISNLADHNERVATVAEMTIFGGFTQEQIAEHFGVVKRTIGQDWAIARAWLARELDLRPGRTRRQDTTPLESEPPS